MRKIVFGRGKMKRTLSVILLFAFALSISAYATTIDLVAQDFGNGIVQVGYIRTSGDTTPTAISLEMSVTGAAVIVPLQSDVSVSEFNFSPDYVFDYQQPGHPFAQTYGVGVQEFPSETVSISMAYNFTPNVDFDYDGNKNDNDIDLFIQDWLGMGYAGTDLNGDRIVNMADMALFNGTTAMPAATIENLFTLSIQDFIPGQTQLIIDSDTLRGGVFDSLGNEIMVNSLAITLVPEPATLLLLGLGGFMLRKRKSHS